MFALGVTPAGVTEGIENPAAAGLPTFGTGYQLDFEAMAALEPDLIIANAQLQAQMADQLSAIAPTLYVLTLTADDVPRQHPPDRRGDLEGHHRRRAGKGV